MKSGLGKALVPLAAAIGFPTLALGQSGFYSGTVPNDASTPCRDVQVVSTVDGREVRSTRRFCRDVFGRWWPAEPDSPPQRPQTSPAANPGAPPITAPAASPAPPVAASAASCTGNGSRRTSRIPERPPRFALIIAVSDYNGDGLLTTSARESADSGFLQDLQNPSLDGWALQAALCRLGFQVFLSENPTRARLEEDIALFGNRLAGTENPVALVFYSGHAIQINGENWLIPSRAQLPLNRDLTRLSEQAQAGVVAAHAVRLQTVFQYFRNPELGSGGVNLVFLDACRNNPWYEQLFGRSRSALSRGLADQPPPSRIGTLVAYSTSYGDVALDGPTGRNSPFAAALLALIERPEMNVQELLRQVRARVYRQVNQAPAEYGTLIDPFCFAGCAAVR
jgi:hypothetical protein